MQHVSSYLQFLPLVNCLAYSQVLFYMAFYFFTKRQQLYTSYIHFQKKSGNISSINKILLSHLGKEKVVETYIISPPFGFLDYYKRSIYRRKEPCQGMKQNKKMVYTFRYYVFLKFQLKKWILI